MAAWRTLATLVVLLAVARGAPAQTYPLAETVKPGVVVSQGIWWNKFTRDGVNCNTTTSTRLTDLGAAATFFDNLVEVAAAT